MEQEIYTLEVAGLTRKLQICPVNEQMSIAAFVMFSDVELTVHCAAALLKICPEHDVIITAESKGIPLAYEMAKQEDKPYLLARKSTKLYMKNPIAVQVNSITTKGIQTLYIDTNDFRYMEGKRVLIVDDVISTGESLLALEQLVNRSGGRIVGKAAVLAEGEAAKRRDILFLQELPLFFR